MPMCAEIHVGLHENWSLQSFNINKLKFNKSFLFYSVSCHKNCSFDISEVVTCIEIERAEQF